MDEKIAELCVLDPIVEDWGGEVYAGFSNTLARVILEESLEIRKPGESNNYLQSIINNEYNEVSNNFGKQMPAIILRAFPAYKIEDIENMPLRRQVEIYAQAIWVLNEIEPNPYGIIFADEDE